jgi:hypothetical protein
MSNCIREVVVSDTRIEPVAAEVRISVFPERLTHTTDIRGQLVGPRCAYATTVEVAYPMRTWSLADQPREMPHLSLSVVIPEPSLWEPQTPFLYEGAVELWENGRCCDQASIRHGLRDLRVNSRGVRLNGRPFPIRGVACHSCSPDEAARLRQSGINTLLTPDLSANPDIMDAADRLGFLILGRIAGPVDAYYPFNPALPGHACSLGWVLTEDALGQESLLIAAHLLASFDNQGRLGAELSDVPSGPLPDGIRFIVCAEDLLPSLSDVALPKIIRTMEKPDESEEWQAVLSNPGILGWVWDPSSCCLTRP